MWSTRTFPLSPGTAPQAARCGGAAGRGVGARGPHTWKAGLGDQGTGVGGSVSQHLTGTGSGARACPHSTQPTFTQHCTCPLAHAPPPTSQVVVHNVPVRRGLLLLGPDNTALLGGQVGGGRG